MEHGFTQTHSFNYPIAFLSIEFTRQNQNKGKYRTLRKLLNSELPRVINEGQLTRN